MKPKILSKWAILIAVPSGFVLFAMLLLNFIPKNSTQSSLALLDENVATPSNEEQVSVELPVQLNVPGGGVDSTVISVGLTPGGAVDASKGNDDQGSSTLLVEKDVASSSQEQTIVGLPARLKIPVIGVDAPVNPVGLTSDGAMGVPKGPADVAWYNLGPRPGDSGSAVIAGHFGWKNNIPAVFDNLHKLRKGDKMSVEDEKGVVITFVVREVRTYDKDSDASDVFGSGDGKVNLNLITCTGAWNKKEKTFSKRLVVFADKE
jgi:LPXTG-site transpeptidase (sortase) family protein